METPAPHRYVGIKGGSTMHNKFKPLIGIIIILLFAGLALAAEQNPTITLGWDGNWGMDLRPEDHTISLWISPK